MTGPEVMRAFREWQEVTVTPACLPRNAYPLYVATNGPYAGRWYIRERMPGTRVWRAEEDGSFTLLGSPLMEVMRG